MEGASDHDVWHGSENDLPLLSNTSNVLVRHFILDLDCNLKAKVFSGSITLFLDLSNHGENRQVFSIQQFQKSAIERKELNVGQAYWQPISSKYFDSVPLNDEDSYLGYESAGSDDTKFSKPFELVLDCCDIEVHVVRGLSLDDVDINELDDIFCMSMKNAAAKYRDLHEAMRTGLELPHKTDKWSLRIQNPRSPLCHDFPPIVKIRYSTKAEGASLRWATDQDGNPCVYTAGMWINNRSMMPCQEYGSLSTWQAIIRVAPPARVIMSGDNNEKLSAMDDGSVEYYYQSSMPLPSFALALAVGTWEYTVISHNGSSKLSSHQGDEEDLQHDITADQLIKSKSMETHSSVPNVIPESEHESKSEENVLVSPKCSTDDHRPKPDHLQASVLDRFRTCHHRSFCCIPYAKTSVLPCRIFAPKSLIQRSRSKFLPIFSKYCIAVQHLLGPFPYPRMDILLYPSCSQDMAMCNPNLLFISQSVLAGEPGSCIRLGHELSHYWFGLLLGARDWTEEWLSEGFATYVEDLVQADVMGWAEKEAEDHMEMAAYLRYKTLAGEVQHTSSELQTLRPNHGKGLESSQAEPNSVMFIKNGMNPGKLFTQVHYLKGYFLLRWLGNIVGVENYRAVFKEYIVKHHGKMTTSHDFLSLVFQRFPLLNDKGHSVSSVCADWLDCTGLPDLIKSFEPSQSNCLFTMVKEEQTKWEKLDRYHRHTKSTSKRLKMFHSSDFQDLSPQQLLILLNELLKKKSFSVTTLSLLSQHYSLLESDTDVQHRWFELVVKHQYVHAYKNLEEFLLNHQAMGIYLYGEMVISRCPKLWSLAKECFKKIEGEMDPTTRSIVHSMLYGS